MWCPYLRSMLVAVKREMTTVRVCLTSTLSASSSSSSSTSPPISFPPNSNSNSNSNSISSISQSNKAHGVNSLSRRQTSLLLTISPFLPYLLPSSPPPSFAAAATFNFGISGPKDWLREQKKKSIKYLLAPIDASQQILLYAYQLLLSNDKVFDPKDFQALLISASRDCVLQDRNSVVAFQARTGVEVCTFKLIVTNAASLLDDRDAAKLEAEARLDNLIRSFTLLNGMVKEADFQVVSDRQRVANAVMDSLSSLDKFEQGIKGCIEV